MKARKPFPGMGEYVLVLRYTDHNGSEWVGHAGAKTIDGARKHRRKLPQWSSDDVRIIHNVPGAIHPNEEDAS